MDSTHSSPSFAPQFRDMKPPTLTQPPSYPSPARSDSVVTYSPDGLGLYNYSMPLSAGGPHNNSLYTPSPQPNEAWNPQISSTTSPLMPEVSSEAWPSLYDPPVSRSPLSWNQPFSFSPGLMDQSHSPGLGQHHFSHRSSVSSSNETSMYSRATSESVFTPIVKLESPHEWLPLNDGNISPHSVMRQQPLTVSPDRLSNSALPYGYEYQSPTQQKYESVATGEFSEYGARNSSRSAPPERRRTSGRRHLMAGHSQRTRIRRNPTTLENAQYACRYCKKLFQRAYNHKAHLSTHDPNRDRPHRCMHPDCERSFVRKTDLVRHEQSVHLKTREFNCGACDAHFARRDTLRRHEEDGCSRRFDVTHHSVIPLRTATRRSAGEPDVASSHQGFHNPAGARSPVSPEG